MKLKSLTVVGVIIAGVVAGVTASYAAPSLLPGMPAPLNSGDIYAADRPGELSPVVKNFPSLIYVPNTNSNTVTVIDPKTM